MSEENKELVKRYYEAFDKRDLGALRSQFLPEDHQFHFPGAPTMDREGHLQIIQSVQNAFPDFRHHVEDQIAEGNKVVSRGYVTGTHRGEFMGVPASGKTITVPFINIWLVEKSKNKEEWLGLDTLGMMQQIGAIPNPGA